MSLRTLFLAPTTSTEPTSRAPPRTAKCSTTADDASAWHRPFPSGRRRRCMPSRPIPLRRGRAPDQDLHEDRRRRHHRARRLQPRPQDRRPARGLRRHRRVQRGARRGRDGRRPRRGGARPLRQVQNDLFDVGADLCTPIASDPKYPPLRVTEDYVTRLEGWCDAFNEGLPKLDSFILPGGTPGAAYLHVARTVARRAERSVWALLDGRRRAHEPADGARTSTGSRTCCSSSAASRTRAATSCWQPSGRRSLQRTRVPPGRVLRSGTRVLRPAV